MSSAAGASLQHVRQWRLGLHEGRLSSDVFSYRLPALPHVRRLPVYLPGQRVCPLLSGAGMKSVESRRIPSNPVESRRIPSNPVKSSQIPSNHVKSRRIPSNTVESRRIAPNPIQSRPIPSNPVKSGQIPLNPVESRGSA